MKTSGGVDKMRADQERVRLLLQETIILLCRNGLFYESELKIEGVLGITVDQNHVFVVHVNETLSDQNDLNSTSTAMVSKGSADLDLMPPTRHDMSPTTSRCRGENSAQDEQNADEKIHPHFDESNPLTSKNSRVKTEPQEANDDSVLIASDNSDQSQNVNEFESAFNDTNSTNRSYHNAESQRSNQPNGSFLASPSNLALVKYPHFSSWQISSPHVRQNARQSGPGQFPGFRTKVRHRSFTRTSRTQSSGGFSQQVMLGGTGDYAIGSLGQASSGKANISKWEGNSTNSVGRDEQEALDAEVEDETGGEQWAHDADISLQEFGSLRRESHDLSVQSGGGDGRPYVCEYNGCALTFCHSFTLYRHQRLKHGKRFGAIHQTTFHCPHQECGRVFYREGTLSNHQRDVHGDVIM